MDYQERTWAQLTLERGRQLFQEALSHLEVALGEVEYSKESPGCWSPECECGVDCPVCGQWRGMSPAHEPDCTFAAAEAFLAKHKEK